ncbi:hypothetical protein IFM89_012534 [Coptis chinensis]|uniref:C2 domain-containing protein n=1 Tax=Coptis chinensis TaxID=261450 RepID=A0A835HK53_9MAGN|nr:hypothetical protein IFM89_012534 [Coptis chinensis]
MSFKCSLASSTILFVVYCSAALTSSQKIEIQSKFEAFLEQRSDSDLDNNFMRKSFDPMVIYVLTPNLPKSDLRPTAKQYVVEVKHWWVLELEFLSAQGLMPMKTKNGHGTTDAYDVAKYGQKWVRTRTIIDSFAPKWNEQYTWEVYDPCTVITIGVFDNCHLRGADKIGASKDSRIGKLDSLRHQATQIVSMRLSRAEPPLRKEVVEYMLDVNSHMWSMRRSKANFFRIMGVLSGIIDVFKWFDQICNWKNPLTSVLIHVLFLILVMYPELILPTIFLYLFLIGVWYYRWRPRHPPHMDTHLSHADKVHPNELDEEISFLLAVFRTK